MRGIVGVPLVGGLEAEAGPEIGGRDRRCAPDRFRGPAPRGVRKARDGGGRVPAGGVVASGKGHAVSPSWRNTSPRGRVVSCALAVGDAEQAVIRQKPRPARAGDLFSTHLVEKCKRESL